MRKLYVVALILTIIIFVSVIIVSIDNDQKNNIFKIISNIFGKTSSEQNIDESDTQNNRDKNKKFYVALILDDAGVNKDFEILNFNEPINISLLPDSLYLDLWLDMIKNKSSIEALIHIPMASINNPESGLYPGMALSKIKKKLDLMLKKVNVAKGANNHEGSLSTADYIFMNDFFKIYKKYNLYFVDSLTTPDSTALSVAKKFGIPSLKRTHFIDNKKTLWYIKRQLKRSIKYIKKNGYGVLIGHTTTKGIFNILNEMKSEFKKNKIEFIHVSDLIKHLKKLKNEIS